MLINVIVIKYLIEALISLLQWNLYKADTSVRRTVWRGTDCFTLWSNYLGKNLYKAHSSIKRTIFLNQWCLLYRDSTVLVLLSKRKKVTQNISKKNYAYPFLPAHTLSFFLSLFLSFFLSFFAKHLESNLVKEERKLR